METQENIVITGCGIVSGLGVGVKPFWEKLKNGESSIQIKDEWNTPDLDCSIPAYYSKCADFSISEHFTDLKPPFPLRYSQLAMMGCKLAIEDANLNLANFLPEQIGLVLDTSCSSNAAAEAFLFKLFQDGPAKVSPFIFTKTTTNCALGDVARAFTLRGPSSILLGENSVCYGYDLIKAGKADVVICGGFDEIRETALLANQHRGYLPLVEKDGKRRTFKEALVDEQGIVVYGEASAFVVLESESHAKKRGANIYAQMLDYHVSGDDAYNDFLYERSTDSLKQHLEDFRDDRNIDFDQVSLMVGASGMPWNVREYEAPAINAIWKNSTKPSYTTVKGLVGEGFSSSPITSLITAALCLQNDTIIGSGYNPQQVGLGGSAPKLAISYNFEDDDIALVNSIHMGGNTVTVALKK
jgi:3-oxoacyl-[acyl-carrier-protein] synthase II